MKFWKRAIAVITGLVTLFVIVYLVFTGQQLIESGELPMEVIYETTAGSLSGP